MKKFLLIALLAAMVLIAGCVQQGQPQPQPNACTADAKICPDGSSVGRSGPNCEFAPCPLIEPQPVEQTPDFSFKTPTESAIVDSTFTAQVVPVNFDIGTAGTANKQNEGHFHFFLDNGSYIPIENLSYEFKKLKPGTHTLKATLNNNDHSPIGVEKMISFNVVSTNSGFNAKITEQTDKTVKIALDAWNFEFGIGTTNEAGKGHYHWFLDGGTYNILTGTEFEIKNLSQGMHSVRITMNNNDHSDVQVNGVTVEQTLNFEIVPKASFKIESPLNNAKVSSPVMFKLTTTNFRVGILAIEDPAPTTNINKPNEGHFHYFLDNGSYNVLNATEFSLKGLKPGLHSIRITANNNDHTEITTIPAQTAKFYVETPNSGFEIMTPTISGTSATFNLEWWNFNIGNSNDPKRVGYGHFHYFVDGGTYQVLDKTNFTMTDLAPGPHTVRVVMQYNDHSDYLVDEEIVQHTISLTMP
ncbi:MAG: hypothetical protein Q7S21_03640 [archaeon]|nr:hypothetical protein [archaeon]